MKRHMRVGWTLLLSPAIAGCIYTPSSTRWANNPELPAGDTAPSVSVYLAPSDPPAARKMSDLSEAAQEAYVTAVSNMTKTPADLRAELAKPIASADAEGMQDNTKFNRTLVISIAKGAYRPADRILATSITIEPRNFSFSGYSVVSTEYETIDISDVTLSRNSSFNAKFTPKFSGSVDGPLEVGATTSRGIDEKFSISNRIPKPYVEIEPCKLVLKQESERGMDISGTTLIKLTLVANTFLSAGGGYGGATGDCHTPLMGSRFLFVGSTPTIAKGGVPLSPSEASLRVVPQHNLRRGALKAEVSMRYVMRQVLTGGATYSEDDDHVRIIDGVVDRRPIDMLSAGDIATSLWGICVSDGPNHDIGIAADLRNGTGGELLFDNLFAATNMAAWMVSQKAWSIGKIDLSISGLPRPADYPRLRVCRK